MDNAVDISEAIATTLVSESQAFVINPEAVQESRLQIMNGNWIFNHIVSVRVGLSVGEPCLDATAGHPYGETPRVVVSTEVLSGQFALAVVCPTKFATPNDESIFKHAPLFKVAHKSRTRPLRFLALVLDSPCKIAVLIPPRLIKLDEANTLFSQSSGKEAVCCKGARVPCIFSVFFEGMVRFIADIGNTWDGLLHPVGKFILGQLSFNERIMARLQ